MFIFGPHPSLQACPNDFTDLIEMIFCTHVEEKALKRITQMKIFCIVWFIIYVIANMWYRFFWTPV